MPVPIDCYLCGKTNVMQDDVCCLCGTSFENQQRKSRKMEVWMNCAWEVSSLATCDRLHVGSVIVNNNRVVSTGYNGSPSGFDHCDDVGHNMVEGHCLRVTHSEANAIIQAPQRDLEGADIYCTHRPCHRCFLQIAQAGIDRIIFDEVYKNADCEYAHLARKNDIKLIQWNDEVEGNILEVEQ